MNLSSFVSGSDLSALYRPPGEALGLPGRVYGSEFFALEQRQLFPRTWCAAGFASDIPEPGDAWPAVLAGWPLLLVRDENREVRAFHNVCRHRANRVVDAPCRKLKSLTCPWHGWTYAFDGSLVGTPRLGGERAHRDEDFPTTGLALKPIPAVVWLDLVMVNIEGNAPPFEQHIQPLNDLLSDYHLGDIQVGARWDTAFEGNWKLTVEGALEDYHLSLVHPELVDGVATLDPRLHFAQRCYFGNSTRDEPTTREVHAPLLLREGVGTENDVHQCVPHRRDDSAPGLGVALGHTARRSPPHVVSIPASTTRDRQQALLALAALRRSNTDFWKGVLVQDEPLVANVQRNMDRPGDAGIRPRFSPLWESNVQRFQQSVVDTLREAEQGERDFEALEPLHGRTRGDFAAP